MIHGTKKTITIVFALAFAVLLQNAVFAQSFTVSSTSATASTTVESYAEPYVNVTNHQTGNLTLDISIVENTLPEDWWVTICLVNCFAPGVTEVQDVMGVGTTLPLKLTVTTGATAGSGIVRVKLQNHNNAFDNAEVLFEISASTVSNEKNADISQPRVLSLAQNYPNPVNLGGTAVTTIAYGVPSISKVSLKVYNLLGKEVRTIVSETRPQGIYTSIWDGKDNSGHLVPPGVYVYKLSNGKATQTRRMLITR